MQPLAALLSFGFNGKLEAQYYLLTQTRLLCGTEKKAMDQGDTWYNLLPSFQFLVPVSNHFKERKLFNQDDLNLTKSNRKILS